ncbi:MAG: hypothetical protein EA376_09225 [Phycisphaeraceae bacterium]|nr:MAG: hypothetical protein EA376_09225 [Phycisphaeraceae bacterium]
MNVCIWGAIGLLLVTGHTALASTQSETAGPEAAIDIGPDFDAAESSEFEHVMRIEQMQRAEFAGEHTLTADMTRRIAVRTLETLDDGGARVELRLTAIALRVLPPLDEIWEYDSEREMGNPVGSRSRFLEGLLDLPLVMVMDSAGQVVNSEGFDAVERLMQRERAARDLFPILNREWFEGTAQEIFGICGGQRLREPGEGWKKRSATRAGGLGDGDTIVLHRIESVENDRVVITGTGEIEVDPDAPPLIAGSETEISRQDMEFKVVWDRRLGRLERYETVQEVVLSHGGEWMEAVARLKTEVTMTRLDPAP